MIKALSHYGDGKAFKRIINFFNLKNE